LYPVLYGDVISLGARPVDDLNDPAKCLFAHASKMAMFAATFNPEVKAYAETYEFNVTTPAERKRIIVRVMSRA
jgi:hypothetical protein